MKDIFVMLYEKVRLFTLGRWQCHACRIGEISKYFCSQKPESKYTDEQKEKILKTINDNKEDALSQFDITKSRLKNFSKWKDDMGEIRSISDIELIQGFTERTATKFFDSILEGKTKTTNNIRGQILNPHLRANLINESKTVLAVYTTVNSVCWSLIDKEEYKLLEWQYHSMEHKEGKKLQMSDIMATAWQVTTLLPKSDLYVMKSEPTTLRAAGSDPNNPKILAVNLQKSQLISMMVALLNARNHTENVVEMEGDSNKLTQRVFFLRSTLPFKLFGTLVGNERVSSDQTIEALLPTYTQKCTKKTHVYIPHDIVKSYKSRVELEKDMLGRCLFLALTFMDLCIYKHEGVKRND